MKKLNAQPWAFGSWEGSSTEHGVNILQVGSRVHVTSYSPFRGLRGIVRTVDTIAAEVEEPFCFYLVVLEGAHIKEPIWFEYNEVEVVIPRAPGDA